jgi:hypothetical protein
MAVTAEGQLANGKGIMSAAGDQFQARFNSGKPNSTTTAAAIPEGSATEAVKPKTNFFTPDGMLGAYGVQASVTGAMIPAQGKL